MEAVLTPHHATEQQTAFAAPNNKQIRMKRNERGSNLVSNNNRSENFDTYAGLLNPPARAMSLSSISLFNQQPPLLPLPHVHHQKNRTKHMSLTPKKSKPTKREEVKKRSGTQSILMVANSDNRWGPDPKDLPKHLPVVLTSKVVVPGMDDMFSASVFNLSPPPSSLPLPKFFLRSKLICNAKAAGGGVDDGATNNLRRLLRLR